ncbi:ubiquitin-conjugating enzyme E2 T-like [Styela clava]|uniref:ubiquitin-conjugating enzyme E2 T-like n=1 Tax=Styela clava TaxID=7725 RepID=UPI001939D961|nr:ubiquitin-conjugating enzyme E2 T-like [Styela clava]
MQKAARLKRELEMLQQSPPPGVSCNQDETNKDLLHAQIIGSEGTPYYGGLFQLQVTVTDRYPFEPPKVIFQTPIYHPNIDNGGRICLDSLKMPPQGAWKPSLNISSLLITIQLLMAEPNPDDPLMTDISSEFKCNRNLFNEKAKQWTRKYAMQKMQIPTRPKNHIIISSDEDNSFTCKKIEDIAMETESAQCSGTGSNSRKRTSSDTDHQSVRKKR